MASGSGKTYAAVTEEYRLIKFGGARGILFLVDRNTLGKQALQELTQYRTPDDRRKFTELYNVQRLLSNQIDPVSRVCITYNSAALLYA
ncbi:MAG TPA: DEAD/DEAH box helicase family protein [Candidatus Binatia bacterium]|nr:DEAD/DEAH box helicase family protein [Candidatus Binatia bacterium]